MPSPVKAAYPDWGSLTLLYALLEILWRDLPQDIRDELKIQMEA